MSVAWSFISLGPGGACPTASGAVPGIAALERILSALAPGAEGPLACSAFQRCNLVDEVLYVGAMAGAVAPDDGAQDPERVAVSAGPGPHWSRMIGMIEALAPVAR